MNLSNKCYDHLSENTMSDLSLKEESACSEKNTSDNEDFRTTILQPFQFEPEQKKTRSVMRAMRKEHNIFTIQLLILHSRIENLDWYKSGHCKNEVKEIDCLYCREVDAM